MNGKDWNDLGGDLNRIIEDAVHMGDFGRLNENINRTIKKAFQGISGEEFRSGDGWDFDLSGKNGSRNNGTSNNGAAGQASQQAGPAGHENRQQGQAEAYDYGRPGGTSGYGTAGTATGPGNQGSASSNLHRQQTRGYAYRADSRPAAFAKNTSLFAGSSKRRGGAIAMLVSGIIVASLSFMPLISLLISIAFSAAGAKIGSAIMLFIMLEAGVFLIVKGATGLSLAKRFDQYVRSLENSEYADIEKLAVYCHKSEKEIIRDIRKMLGKGWFLQGHLDKNEKCLMVSNRVYEQYLETEKNTREREAEEARMREEELKRTGGLTPEVRAILEKGSEYIESIRKSNDAIPGEEVSEKIYRMELLVRRIFQQTEAHPENARDLRKMMDYYLPMTVKLLGAYEELDRQPVQGENILNSKKEIEDTLDTLNSAFAKLLDNLFEDTAWDVSSDISVLQTMLAQEGLMEDGLKK